MPFPILFSVLLASASFTPEGTVTVPLKDLLALQEGAAGVNPATPSPPPVSALVTRAVLQGRLGESQLAVEAGFDVDVLDGASWSRVELLELGDEAWLTEVSPLEGATVAVSEGKLVLLSNREGQKRFTVKVSLRANGNRAERRAQLKLGKHVPPVPLSIESDGAVFAVREHEVLPQARVLTVVWREVAPVAEKQEVVRPPLEPRVPTASATWITTLEGNLTLRASYAVRLDREQKVSFALPPEHMLRRATINGVPVPTDEAATTVTLAVAPSRLGETTANVELVLERKLGIFHLAGEVKLELPRVSLPIDALSVQAHLPAVFNYRRAGGSLEMEGEQGAATIGGLPGKALHFRQMLVGDTAPTLELAYSVDIRGSYFR